MKTKTLKTIRRKSYSSIKVTDVDGNVEWFKTTKAAAEAMNCTPALVCRALRSGKLCVGCKVEEAVKEV